MPEGYSAFWLTVHTVLRGGRVEVILPFVTRPRDVCQLARAIEAVLKQASEYRCPGAPAEAAEVRVDHIEAYSDSLKKQVPLVSTSKLRQREQLCAFQSGLDPVDIPSSLSPDSIPILYPYVPLFPETSGDKPAESGSTANPRSPDAKSGVPFMLAACCELGGEMVNLEIIFPFSRRPTASEIVAEVQKAFYFEAKGLQRPVPKLLPYEMRIRDEIFEWWAPLHQAMIYTGIQVFAFTSDFRDVQDDLIIPAARRAYTLPIPPPSGCVEKVSCPDSFLSFFSVYLLPFSLLACSDIGGEKIHLKMEFPRKPTADEVDLEVRTAFASKKHPTPYLSFELRIFDESVPMWVPLHQATISNDTKMCAFTPETGD
eukprot:TRINITY_DN2630_c0_g1_i11.p1 TRINITY_DN2630_c0_g1~~TRINITY_DN2630_c0_g1_i11.p1  ORF type:complete len:371 (+),score=37.64 TRINITY_DN2630_c0_g1_i11:121-1233(+)